MNLDRLATVAGLVLLGAAGVLSAVLEVLLVPLRIGTTLIPITVLCALVLNVILLRTALAVLEATGAMAIVFAAWLLPVLILSMTPRPEGDVLVRAGGGEQWVFYALLLAGAVAGAATIVQARSVPARPSTPPGPRRRVSGQSTGSLR